jgi:hypothetical protein
MSADGFAREKKPARWSMISFRMTEDERALLGRLAAKLELSAMADVLRNALDHYLTTHPDAVKAMKSLGRAGAVGK